MRARRIEHQLYASEDTLQGLIAKHPEVLAGDQIDLDAPPRWFLIRREPGIPDSSDGGDRWSVDHLLLDQFGMPTLVEVKRSTDPRIRREVVGQMLDYVANAQAYWGDMLPVENRHQSEGISGAREGERTTDTSQGCDCVQNE